MHCLLLLILTSIFSNNLGHIPTPPIVPEMAEEICYQPFNYFMVTNGLGFSKTQHWMMADDFTCNQSGCIESIQIWAVYPQAFPETFNIELRNSSEEGPSTIVNSYATRPCVHTNTGYTMWGYPLYHTEILDMEISFEANTKYWLAIQSVGGSGAHYWLATPQIWADLSYFSDNDGDTWTSSLIEWGYAYEQFFIADGYTNLHRTSWAEIKSFPIDN